MWYLHVGGKVFDGFLHSISQDQHFTVAAPPRFTSRAGMVLLIRSLSHNCTCNQWKMFLIKNVFFFCTQQYFVHFIV